MGHVDPVSTAVYLTITPGLLSQANRRFEAFAETGLGGGGAMIELSRWDRSCIRSSSTT